MGYIDKQVSTYRKSLDAASSGATLRNAIRKLQEKSQINDSLKPLKARGTIVSKAGQGKRTASATAGIASPLTETIRSRMFYSTPRELTSSDGLFVLEYFNTKQITMVDSNNQEAVFIYADYVPS